MFSVDPVTRLPKSKRENSVFCVDLKKTRNVLADDNGSFSQSGNRLKFYSIKTAGKKEITIKKVVDFDTADYSIYECRKVYHRSKSEPFKKKLLRRSHLITTCFISI